MPPMTLYDAAGNGKLVSIGTVYNSAGNAKQVIGGWVYDAAGNAKRFSGERWTMDFSGPNLTCGGRTGPCASVVTASCYTPMGSATYFSGTPPAAAFRIAHVKNASPAAGAEFVLWINQAVVDPYVSASRIISINGTAENASVTAHVYDNTVSSYGYVFGPISKVMAPATSYRIVFA